MYARALLLTERWTSKQIMYCILNWCINGNQ